MILKEKSEAPILVSQGETSKKTPRLTGLKSRILARRPWMEENYPRLAAYLKRLAKSSKRLKQPTFYGAIVLYPLRLLLCSNLHLFWTTYKLSGMVQRRYRSKNRWKDEEEGKIQKVLRDLKEFGVAKWEGMYNTEQIQRANALMDQLMERSREQQRKARPGLDGVRDAGFPEWEHTWELIESEFASYASEDPSWIYGRTRSRCYNPPPVIKTFFNDPRISEVANRYFGGKTSDKRVLLEELTPSLMGDNWHVDCMGKAFKAMILTTDCSIKNGPLRYKVGSHRLTSLAKKRAFYHMMKYGYSFSAISLLEYRTIPGEVFFGTGKAGDCIFFDPTGIHSGSRSLEGKRRGIIIPRHAPTFQSVLFECLGAVTS